MACLSTALALLLLGGFLRVQTPGTASVSAAAPYRPGAVLVGFRPGVNRSERASALAARGLVVQHVIEPLGLASLSVPPGEEPAAVSALRQLPEVEFAELDYLAQAVMAPGDPAWANQWSLLRIGLPAAWNVTTGTTSIIIAIVDSGVYLEHPDLASKLWTNPGEIPGNASDDDLNGKVDDVNGWHFFQSWTPGGYIPVENAIVTDEYGHGTHVAGIAAAATNNDAGIAGVSWGAQVMPVRVLDEYGDGWYSDIASGIVYAVDNGAQIINLSLGGMSPSSALCAAAAYAHEQGAVLVAAAGNNTSSVLYPAACPDVLAAAATDRADRRASTSSYGPQVDVAAPGVEIYSTWFLGPDSYLAKSGTSMAAPHVSGVAALIWSRWPDWTNIEVSRQITATAVDVDSPGWDPRTGWGRLDAAAALDASISRLYMPLMIHSPSQ